MGVVTSTDISYQPCLISKGNRHVLEETLPGWKKAINQAPSLAKAGEEISAVG
jgi:hypothetical protein